MINNKDNMRKGNLPKEEKGKRRDRGKLAMPWWHDKDVMKLFDVEIELCLPWWREVTHTWWWKILQQRNHRRVFWCFHAEPTETPEQHQKTPPPRTRKDQESLLSLSWVQTTRRWKRIWFQSLLLCHWLLILECCVGTQKVNHTCVLQNTIKRINQTMEYQTFISQIEPAKENMQKDRKNRNNL